MGRTNLRLLGRVLNDVVITCKSTVAPRQNSLFTGVVRVGSTFSLDETHANSYTPMAMVHGHVWCMVCKVFASDVSVCSALLCNFLS